MKSDSEEQFPMIFLAGPPGAGKSSLGEKACQELDLQFIDLSTPAINKRSFQSQKEILTEVITKRMTIPKGKRPQKYSNFFRIHPGQ